MITVAFYSYKGGVGRTLLAANTAHFLALFGRRVVAIDLDLEAPGLHHKLLSPEVLRRAVTGELRGAVDALLECLEGAAERLSLCDLAIQIDLPTDIRGSLALIPAGSAPSKAYWSALEQVSTAHARASRRNGGLLEAVLELQARIGDEIAPDFLLIDSRTGITELGGLATSLLADRVVCLTTTAPDSIEGTMTVAEALRTAPRLPSQLPLKLDFLVTRVPRGSDVSETLEQLSQAGDPVAVLPDVTGATEEQLLAGWRPFQPKGDEGKKSAASGLFSATLEWIARAFPNPDPPSKSSTS